MGGNIQQYPDIFLPHSEKVVLRFFDRHGGVSTFPYASNNVSFGVGDPDKNVQENRRTLKSRMQLSALVSARQVHGDAVFRVVEAPQDSVLGEFDAIVTDQIGVGLLIQTADCQPVFLYDPGKNVIGAVHSGWRGSVQNIVGKTLLHMQELYGSSPDHILCAIGPSLGPCCGEFIHYKSELPRSFFPYMVEENHFDFWQITVTQLLEKGVSKENISVAGICTSCSDDYFSYRRACRENGGITGRNGAVIALRSERDASVAY